MLHYLRTQAFVRSIVTPAIATAIAVWAGGLTALQTDYSFSAEQWGRADLTLTLPFGDREFLSTFNAVPNFEPIADFTTTNRYRQLANAVGRLDIMFRSSGSDSGQPGNNSLRMTTCTATLIAEDYLISNYHCIPGRLDRTVVKATIRFGYLSTDDRGRRYDVDVEPVEANEGLDYTILRVDGQPSRRFGHIPLQVRDPAPREELFILHHPEGQPQRLTRKNCRLSDSPASVSAEQIRHRCDTSGGSSGSLIFSDNNDGSTFHVVGLHYAGFRGVAGPSSSNVAKPLTTIVGQSQFLREHSAVVGASTSGVIDDVPASCRPGADYGSLRVRSPVRLGRHRSVRGSDNWNADMSRFVGRVSRVRALPGVDGQECLTVRVDIDDGQFVWRVADLQVAGEADTGTPLTPGDWASGRLSEGESDWWTFTAQAGDRISIEMTSNDFDTYLELRDPDGELLREDDDSGRETDSYIENQILPVAGHYTVVARAYEADHSSGAYEIILEASNRLAYGDEMHAELERGQSDDWMLSARQGDRISVVVESDDFDTVLKVIDSDGVIIAENDDSCDDRNSRVFELRVLRTDEWIVRVEAFGDDGLGRYTLLVVRGRGATAGC